MTIKLRQWRDEDRLDLADAANNERIAAYLRMDFPYPYTVADADFFIELVRTADPALARFFAVEVDGRAVGSVSMMYGSDVYRRNAEIGYWLAEPLWGQGIMTEAVRRVCDMTFAETQIRRIEAEVMATNPASVRVLEKNGFRQEGCLTRRVFKRGRYIDTALFAKLAQETEQQR